VEKQQGEDFLFLFDLLAHSSGKKHGEIKRRRQ
jgi:hypothetical protein